MRGAPRPEDAQGLIHAPRRPHTPAHRAQVDVADPVLAAPLDLEPARPTEVIVGCELAPPYRVRVLRRTEGETLRLAGGLLPGRCRVRLPDLAAAWGGRAMALVDGWQDQGFSTERHDLGTSCTFARREREWMRAPAGTGLSPPPARWPRPACLSTPLLFWMCLTSLL